MTAIPLTEPIILKNATLRIDADNFEAAISQVSFEPTKDRQTIEFVAISGDSVSDTTTSPSKWVCNITYAQDWQTDASLANYLHEHEDDVVTAVFIPQAGSGMPSFTSDLTIDPGAIGGQANQYVTSSVSLPATRPVKGETP